MIKILSFITSMIIVLIILSLFSAPTPIFKENSLYEKCLYPTILISDGIQGGSGFIVRSEKINDKYCNAVITAGHNVDDRRFFTAKVCNYNKSHIVGYDKYEFIVYHKSVKFDIAVGFFVTNKPMPKAELGFEKEHQMGDKVFHIGFGLFDDARLDYGIITQPSSFEPEPFKGLIRTNAYTVVGDSGGPLFTLDNKVIGICHSIRRNGYSAQHNQSYFTNIDNLKTLDVEVNNILESIYKSDVEMPKLPLIELELNQYKE